MLSMSNTELFMANPIVAIVIYAVVFIVVAFLFSAIDYSKILRKEYKTVALGTLLYFVLTVCVTFLVGTFFLFLINVFANL